MMAQSRSGVGDGVIKGAGAPCAHHCFSESKMSVLPGGNLKMDDS